MAVISHKWIHCPDSPEHLGGTTTKKMSSQDTWWDISREKEGDRKFKLHLKNQMSVHCPDLCTHQKDWGQPWAPGDDASVWAMTTEHLPTSLQNFVLGASLVSSHFALASEKMKRGKPQLLVPSATGPGLGQADLRDIVGSVADPAIKWILQ